MNKYYSYGGVININWYDEYVYYRLLLVMNILIFNIKIIHMLLSCMQSF